MNSAGPSSISEFGSGFEAGGSLQESSHSGDWMSLIRFMILEKMAKSRSFGEGGQGHAFPRHGICNQKHSGTQPALCTSLAKPSPPCPLFSEGWKFVILMLLI